MQTLQNVCYSADINHNSFDALIFTFYLKRPSSFINNWTHLLTMMLFDNKIVCDGNYRSKIIWNYSSSVMEYRFCLSCDFEQPVTKQWKLQSDISWDFFFFLVRINLRSCSKKLSILLLNDIILPKTLNVLEIITLVETPCFLITVF